jgi:hypothetical protein
VLSLPTKRLCWNPSSSFRGVAIRGRWGYGEGFSGSASGGGGAPLPVSPPWRRALHGDFSSHLGPGSPGARTQPPHPTDCHQVSHRLPPPPGAGEEAAGREGWGLHDGSSRVPSAGRGIPPPGPSPDGIVRYGDLSSRPCLCYQAGSKQYEPVVFLGSREIQRASPAVGITGLSP